MDLPGLPPKILDPFFGDFLVYTRQGLTATDSTLEHTILVFFLLVAYLFYGGGRLSVDHFLGIGREEDAG